MLKDKKVIGVCLTKIQDIRRSDYANRLHYIARSAGYKLIFFNSFVDFFNNDSFDEGAKSVYDLINYDIVDALVILQDSFYKRSVADEIINRARSFDVPTVIINGTSDGCWSITTDYKDALKSVMTHIVKDHGVTDTFFMAGGKGDIESEKRICIYKEVMEENGLAFEEARVGYGDFWEDPTRRVVNSLISDGKKPPRAIFCANDYMAFAVCNELSKFGYRIPEDVIVTGFDGVPAAEHFSPQLTTCREDIETLAKLTVEAVTKALGDKNVTENLISKFVPFISESCGCKKLSNKDYHDAAARLYNTMDATEMHENFMYAWIDRILKNPDTNILYDTLAGCSLENSFVCVNNDFLASIMDTGHPKQGKPFSDELVLIPSKYSSCLPENQSKMNLSDMVPDLNGWADDDSSYILSSIYVDDQVCGYYAVNTDHILGCKHKIKRVLKTINIAFNIAVNYFRQANLRLSIEKAAVTNPITGLPNLKGTVKWFEEYSAIEKNRNRALSVSVYGLPKYTYIYENYGIDAAEDALRFVAESLKIANPTECYIGHIAEDEFIVINYYNDPNDIGEVIQKATSVFFSVIEGYNTSSGKEYFVEVNCGCTVVHQGWSGSLEGFIKFANSEMYMNRLKQGMGSAVKEEADPKEFYKAFNLLIDKNLFNYHFQPIVSAKTGNVVAYEALMRTDASIGMNPLEILDAAKEYNRLYDIEKATMFNVIGRYVNEQERFGDAKVFINTIPGYFLNDDDISLINQKYGNYMDRFVFELTEQNTVSDEELTCIKKLGGVQIDNQIAIDDYGTGHSNIVNLMRYAPHIIKIDRFLITDIHKNQNKQMFVRNTIEFAKINNIKVLAEGVETSNELRMVIDLGVDLIQGYYTGRPSPDPVGAISEEIRKEIADANPLLHK